MSEQFEAMRWALQRISQCPEAEIVHGVAREALKHAANVVTVGWEDLNCYKFMAYPNELLVMTNASKEQMAEAVVEFGNQTIGERPIEMRNIEDILQDKGFVALACNTPSPMIEFYL